MAPPRPAALVLGGGGVLGEAWMSGVLAGISSGSGVDFRACEAFIGTSAGSIVAAALAGGQRPRRPPAEILAEAEAAAGAPAGSQIWRRAIRAGRALTDPLAPFALAAGERAGARPRAAALAMVPTERPSLAEVAAGIEALGVRFDGRLHVVAVERAGGRRVVFGAPDAPPATVAQAVHASCAVPGMFRPVEIDGREYVDGGVWSPTSLDVAPVDPGGVVLCLSPTANVSRPAGGALAALRVVSRSATELEAAALRRRGVKVRTVGPDRDAGIAIGPNLMDRSRAELVLAAGYRQGRALARRDAARAA